MSNQQGRIRFRRRTPWEAADLGARLVAEHMWFYGALWFCAMLPWHLLLTAFFHDRPQWVLYLLWWSKPAFEAGIVAVLSVQVFGKMPTFSDSLKQAWRLIVRPRIVGDLLWRRLSLRRTVVLPITVLEKVKGAQHTRRCLEIGRRTTSQSSWLTFFGVHFEAILLYGILMIVGWILLRDLTAELTPPGSGGGKLDYLEEYFSWWITNSQHWIWHVCNALYLLVLSFWEPFFTAMGFTLYLQARTESEAWDIRLTFRRLAERLGKGTAAVLLAMMLGDGLLMATPSHAETAPDPAQVDQVRAETIASAPFIHTETRNRYCYQSCKTADKPSAAPETRTLPPIALWLRILYWVIGLIVAAAALYLLWLWLRNTSLSTTAQTALPERMFGLDVREESLPESVSATARALFADNPRAALALLYRALLVQLMRREQLLLKDSHTEGEIVRLVSRERPALNHLTENITHAWVYMAYAHTPPQAAQMHALCDQYAVTFEQSAAGGTS